MRRRRDRDEIPLDIHTILAARLRDHRELLRRIADPRRVEERVIHAALLHLLENAARHHIARRELRHRMILRHEPLALAVPQHRARAAHRLRNQEIRAPLERERRRMELHELHIHHLGARAPGHREPAARRALRIRRLAEKPPRAARREHHRRGAQHDLLPIEERHRSMDAPLMHEQIHHITMLERPHARLLRYHRVERARHLRARRIAMRMDDAVAAVTPLAPECEPPIRRAVELRPVRREQPDILRPLRHDQLGDIPIRQPGARHQRILQMQRRIIIAAERRRDAALRLVRIAVKQRIAHREQHRLPRLRQMPGRRQPRHTRADHQRIRLIPRQPARIEIHQIPLHCFQLLSL